MKQKKLLDAALVDLADFKALNIEVLPIAKMSTIADYMVVATGTSKRHVNAIATNLVANMKGRGFMPRVGDHEDNEWTLIDLGDVIVHIMQASTREFYNLEKLWTQIEIIRTSA